MKVAVLKESFPGERRVAFVPANVAQLIKAGCEVLVESNAGSAAGFADALYQAKGATIIDRQQAFHWLAFQPAWTPAPECSKLPPR